jgi:hypothetical protein
MMTLVANAGLIGPATLAQHLRLRDSFDEHVDLGDAPGRANVGDKAMRVVHAVLAGGDSIDDCDALRARATQTVLGHGVLAPSTIGVFLRSFTTGSCPTAGSGGGRGAGRASAAGSGRGDGHLDADLGNGAVALLRDGLPKPI